MDNDAERYRRFLEGDDEGLREIIDIHYNGLVLYINGIIKKPSETEDIVQETLVKLAVKKPKFRGKSSFKTWFFAIATVSSDNKNFSDIDGVLFNKDKIELLLYPVGKNEKEYIIPDGVTAIGHSAFKDCKALESVSLPEGVTAIGYNAFNDCESLESVSLPDSVTNIGDVAFDGTAFLKSIESENGIKYIGSVAYKADNDITSAVIKKGTKGIADSAFNSCMKLESVTFSDSVKTIDNYAFYGCENLKSVTLPVGYGAFAFCVGLTDITIKNPKCEIDEKQLISLIKLSRTLRHLSMRLSKLWATARR